MLGMAGSLTAITRALESIGHTFIDHPNSLLNVTATWCNADEERLYVIIAAWSSDLMQFGA